MAQNLALATRLSGSLCVGKFDTEYLGY